jgi:hypothetical protein
MWSASYKFLHTELPKIVSKLSEEDEHVQFTHPKLRSLVPHMRVAFFADVEHVVLPDVQYIDIAHPQEKVVRLALYAAVDAQREHDTEVRQMRSARASVAFSALLQKRVKVLVEEEGASHSLKMCQLRTALLEILKRYLAVISCVRHFASPYRLLCNPPDYTLFY